jgi:nicotinamidase-related amidase
MFPRSPELLSAEDSALLVIDVQERLVPVLHESARLVWNVGRLVEGAQLLKVFTAATEQYPQGIGPTIPALRDRINLRPEKRSFSCRECTGLMDEFKQRGIYKLLVCGCETHVCVLQSVIDLLGEGFRVHVAADACTSRSPLDHEIALRRMDSCGAVLTTTEAALFEWCETSSAAQFKEISRMVKEKGPG